MSWAWCAGRASESPHPPVRPAGGFERRSELREGTGKGEGRGLFPSCLAEAAWSRRARLVLDPAPQTEGRILRREPAETLAARHPQGVRCPHHLGAWAAQAGTPAPSAPARRWLPPRLVSTKASVRCTVPVRPRPASAVEAGTTQNLVSTTAVGGPTHAGAARFARQAAGAGWARSSVGTNRSTTFHVKRLAPTADGAGSSNPWDRNAGDPRWLISLQPGQRQQAPLALDRPGRRPGERGSGGAGMGAG
jgi:hypothetical protein